MLAFTATRDCGMRPNHRPVAFRVVSPLLYQLSYLATVLKQLELHYELQNFNRKSDAWILVA